MNEGKGILERGLWRNPMSYLGLAMSAVSAILIGVLLIIDMLAIVHSPYLGVLIFFILPVFFMSGFLVMGWGMVEEHKRRRRDAVVEIQKFPILDLNLKRHRLRFFFFLGGAGLSVLLLTVVAYEAYHFTESLTFCGELCHTVMEPEATAAQNSPHARVSCAECHVGPGAGWYVRSKLAGTRQMFAVLLDTFPRPLPPAIQHLRPARETCEECHWPEKFYGSKLQVHTHFGNDEMNTPHDVSLLVKIGGGETVARDGGSGIHWHMLAEKKVTFQAADPALQIIPVVWEELEDGTVVEYRLEGYEEKEGEGGGEGHSSEPRLVDCVVCHNRPTHIYSSPQKSMDKALLEDAVDHKLPYIKKVGVEALVQDYATKGEALEGIDNYIRGFYAKNYPQTASASAESIDRSVKVIQEIYQQNFFPQMKVSWNMYPNNIGHRDFPGCFRCHDGKHVSEDGKVIRRDCEICHSMPQSAPSKHWTEAFPAGQDWETWHPWDLKGKHAVMNCSNCHNGGLPPARDCATCHEQKGVSEYDENSGMGDFGCMDCHMDEQKVLPVMDCVDCHDDMGELHTEVQDHQEADCTTCHKPHTWAVASRETCYECHDDKAEHNPEDMCTDCHDSK